MFVYRYGYTAPMERVVSGWDHDATNIPLPWSGFWIGGRTQYAMNISLRWSDSEQIFMIDSIQRSDIIILSHFSESQVTKLPAPNGEGTGEGLFNS